MIGIGLGLLKLAAGIVGIGLDELVQRDAQRKSRRVTAITATALAAMLTMSALTVFALNARTEAVRQRGAAEGLVEFMLTDLREKLKGVGRLDIMGAVNERALHYYTDQDLKRLPVESLERRARILHSMGEDDETRGDHGAALAKFTEASRTTAVLLADAPNDPERIFDQAQSVYWIGYVDFQRERLAAAERAFLEYKRLADHMVELGPNSTKYRKEEAYAEGNLCAVARRAPMNPRNAMKHCRDALAAMETAAYDPDKYYRSRDAKRMLDADLMDSLADMADAYRLNGDLYRAKAARSREETLLERAMAADPRNTDLKDTWIVLQRSYATLERLQGRRAAAQSRLTRAIAVADGLAKLEPRNQLWAQLRSGMKSELRELLRKELGTHSNDPLRLESSSPNQFSN
jgi:tetratricopeptide (TPR) repeat protein